MAKSLARGLVTMASVTLALAGCRSKPAPPSAPEPMATATASAASESSAPAIDASIIDASTSLSFAKPAWHDAKRASSSDGAVTLDYPSGVFKSISAKNGSVTLKSDIWEPGMSGKGDRVYFLLTLTKLRTDPIDAVKKHLPPGWSDKSPSDDGTVTAYAGANGAKGYAITQGVEGMGEAIRIVTTHDGASWELDCNFCCGMVESAKMKADDQISLCEDVLHAFEAEH